MELRWRQGHGNPYSPHLQQHSQQEAQVHLIEAHLAHRLERLLHLHGGLAPEDPAATATEDLAARWLKIGRRSPGVVSAAFWRILRVIQESNDGRWILLALKEQLD